VSIALSGHRDSAGRLCGEAFLKGKEAAENLAHNFRYLVGKGSDGRNFIFAGASIVSLDFVGDSPA